MKKNSTPYDFEGRIPLSQAIPLGLQHVMAMFIGNLTPLIIVMGLCGLTADAGFGDLRTALLQNAMVMAGIVTLVQLFSIGPVGGKVPIVMGTSSGFLGVLNNTVAACGGGILAYGAIMGACIVGGIFEGVLGMFLKPLRKFFPAIVTGSVVIAIGLSLLGVGINYFCGGSGKADYGSLQNLFLGFVVLIVIILLKHFAPQDSVLSSAAILFGILAGYAVAVVMTLVLPTVGINADGAEYTYSWVVNFEQIKNAAFIFIGGTDRLAAVVEKLVPFMACIYIVGSLIVIGCNFTMIPEAFRQILVGAFQPSAIMGGAAGITVREAIRYGVARGLFSNEAGMGSTPHAHARATAENPHQQGLTAMISVFIDTFVILNLTVFSVLTTGAMSSGKNGTALTQYAFSTVFGSFGDIFIAVCLLFFAFSTILGWHFFGAINVKHLFGVKATKIYSLIVVIFIIVGSTLKVDLVWSLADFFNGLMVIPNALALLALSGVVAKICKTYSK